MDNHISLQHVISTAFFILSLFLLTAVFVPSAHATTSAGYTPSSTTATQLAWYWGHPRYYHQRYYRYGPRYYNRVYVGPRCERRCFTNRWGNLRCVRTCY